MSAEHFFYCAGQLQAILMQGDHRIYLRCCGVLLCELHRSAVAWLPIIDNHGSVLRSHSGQEGQGFAYTCHGYDRVDSKRPLPLGFNGERKESWASSYALGKGYRLYNSELMRFNSPDNLSPFSDGGLNAYGYCEGDPVNRIDPDGHTPPPLPRPIPLTHSRLSRSPTASRQATPPPRPGNPVGRQLQSRSGSLSSTTSSLSGDEDGSSTGWFGRSISNDDPALHAGRGLRSQSSDSRNYYAELDLGRGSPDPQPQSEHLVDELRAAARRLRRNFGIQQREGYIRIDNAVPEQEPPPQPPARQMSGLRDSRSPSR